MTASAAAALALMFVLTAARHAADAADNVEFCCGPAGSKTRAGDLQSEADGVPAFLVPTYA